MSDAVHTCLWFEDRAEEAAKFYTSLLPDSRIDAMHRPAPDAPPVLIHFTIMGVPYTILQAGPGERHSSAVSIAVVLDSQKKADALYDRILEAGGSEVQCGWLTDAWGVSWQIIPEGMQDVLMGGTAEENQRANVAMRAMKRIDLAELQRAARDTTVSAHE